MTAKRILSSLLTMLLLTLCATQSAAAWEQPDSGFTLEVLGSWQQRELRWQPEDASAFFAAADTGELNYSWIVQKVSNPGESPEVLTELPLAASRSMSERELRQEGLLVLTLKAVPTILSGQYKISLCLNGVSSEPVYLWLMDDAALRTALQQARELLANPNSRYTEDYITRLQAAADAAEALYTNAQATPADLAAKAAAIDTLTRSPELALTKSELLNRLIPGWWKFVDLVTSPVQQLQDGFREFMQSIWQVIAVTFTVELN